LSTTTSYPIGFNLWEKFLMWLFPRTYDPWFDTFLNDPPMDAIFSIDYKPEVKTKYLDGICSEHVRIET